MFEIEKELFKIASTDVPTEVDLYSDWIGTGQEPDKSVIPQKHSIYLEPTDLVSDEARNSIRGILSVIFDSLPEGGVARVALMPTLRHLFAPSEVLSGVFERQSRLVQSYATRCASKTGQRVEVVNIEFDPAYMPFIELLREHSNSTQGCDIRTILKTRNLEDKGTFELAKTLLQIAEESTAFRKAMYASLPPELKDKTDLEKEQEIQKIGYLIAKLAIYLSELSNGKNVCAGLQQERLLFEIMAEIVECKTKRGRFRRINRIASLSSSLGVKSTTFVTLKTDPNYFALKGAQQSARVRLALQIFLGAFIIGQPIGYKNTYAEALHAQQESLLIACLEKTNGPSADPHVLEKNFNNYSNLIKNDLEVRYSLPGARWSKIEPFVTNDFCSKGDPIKEYYSSSEIESLVDDFIRRYEYIVISQGGVTH